MMAQKMLLYLIFFLLLVGCSGEPAETPAGAGVV